MNKTCITQLIQPKIKIITILSCFLFVINGITQKCSQSTQLTNTENNNSTPNLCPQNSICNNQGYCSCIKGFYGNCSYQAKYLNLGEFQQWVITQNDTYFLFIPQIEYTTLFSFTIIGSGSKQIIYNIWFDNGYLNSPTSQTAYKYERIFGGSRQQQNYLWFITQFKKQPNGQFENVILSFRLKEPGSLTIKLAITVLTWIQCLIGSIVILICCSPVICFVLFLICQFISLIISKCKRNRRNMRQQRNQYMMQGMSQLAYLISTRKKEIRQKANTIKTKKIIINKNISSNINIKYSMYNMFNEIKGRYYYND